MEIKCYAALHEAIPVPDDKTILAELWEMERERRASRVFKSQFTDLFAEVEDQDGRVADVVVSSVLYSDMRKYCRDIMDFETDADKLKSGLMAYLWGARVWVRKTQDLLYAKAYKANDKALVSDWPDLFCIKD